MTREEFEAEMAGIERRRNERELAMNLSMEAAERSLARAWDLLRSISEHSVLQDGVTADLMRELDAHRDDPTAHRA